MSKADQLLERAEALIGKLEALFHAPSGAVDWKAVAWRWVMLGNHGYLQAVSHPHQISLDNIQFVDAQKAEIVRNTRQFLQSLPANHVLLTGARGTGTVSYTHLDVYKRQVWTCDFSYDYVKINADYRS